jgi:hypothetical protein
MNMTLEQILAIHAIDAKLAERLAEQHRWHEQYICHVYGITTDDYWEVVRLSDGKPVVAHQLAIAELLMGWMWNLHTSASAMNTACVQRIASAKSSSIIAGWRVALLGSTPIAHKRRCCPS